MSEVGSREPRERLRSGVPGLDEILGGGLPSERLYLVQGGPGTGKTTLGLQYLLAGARSGQRSLYVSLLQSRAELEDIAASHGWDLDGLRLLDLPADAMELAESEQTVFSPSEVELHEMTDAIVDSVVEHRPQRMVVDSLSELQLIIDSPHQMRRQLMRLKRALAEIGCTTVLTADVSLLGDQPIVQTLVHGAFGLHRIVPRFGEPQRRLEVQKVRATRFAGGHHDFVIRAGGIEVFPRFSASGADVVTEAGQVVPSGNEELDALCGGGLTTGSVCLVTGTAGAGKSTVTSLYVSSAAARGEFGVVYCFDESRSTYLQRAKGLQLPIVDQAERGLVDLREYAIGDLTPGQLMRDLREDVVHRGARLVVVDSFTGLVNLMPEESDLVPKLHELLRFLSSRGVLTLITVNLHEPFGRTASEIPTSYLADALLVVRHFEAMGRVRRCVAVVKRRHGRHERTIREFEIVPGGLRLGPPLRDFTGLLTGAPRFEGRREELLDRREDGPDEPSGA